MSKSDIKQIDHTIVKLDKKSRELEKQLKNLQARLHDKSIRKKVHSYVVINTDLSKNIHEQITSLKSQLEVNKEKIGNLRLYKENIQETSKISSKQHSASGEARTLQLLAQDKKRIEKRLNKLGFEDLFEIDSLMAIHEEQLHARKALHKDRFNARLKEIMPIIESEEFNSETLQSLANDKANFASQPGDAEIATDLAYIADLMRKAEQGLLGPYLNLQDDAEINQYIESHKHKYEVLTEDDLKRIYKHALELNNVEVNLVDQTKLFNEYIRRVSADDFKSHAFQALIKNIKQDSPGKTSLIGKLERLKGKIEKAEHGKLTAADLKLRALGLPPANKNKLIKLLTDVDHNVKEQRAKRKVKIGESEVRIFSKEGKKHHKHHKEKLSKPSHKKEKETKEEDDIFRTLIIKK